MSTAATIVHHTRPGKSFADWSTSHRFERLVLLYELWVFLILLAPILTRLGWNAAGQVIFFIYFIFLIPIHGALFLLVG